MESKNLELKVKIHYHLAQGGYHGWYDFWTISTAISLGVAGSTAYDLLKLLTKKVISLLKTSDKKGKRVDIVISFYEGKKDIVRVIGTAPTLVKDEGIPSEDEVLKALISTMDKKMEDKSKSVVTELHVSGKDIAHITTDISSENIVINHPYAQKGETVILRVDTEFQDKTDNSAREDIKNSQQHSKGAMIIVDETQGKQVQSLERKLEEFNELGEKKIYLSRTQYTYYFKKWHSETLYLIANIYGENSKETTRFEKVGLLPAGTYTEDVWQGLRKQVMLRTSAELEAILFSLTLPNELKENKLTITASAFVAHGGRTEALNKLQTFLTALGVTTIIAEDEASKGASVDRHITQCLDKADFAIILGTADDEHLKDGKLYPRLNVCIEIGRVQDRLPDRVIYLLEIGATFPSNIAEKVYERFTQDNMEKAQLKIVRELKAFGILRTSGTRK